MVASRKSKEIETIIAKLIAEDISPALAGHNGSCELLACVVTKDKITVMISYQGSCSSCSTSIGPTLNFIKNFIQEELITNGLWIGEIDVITTEDFRKRAEGFEEYRLLDLEA